MLASVRIATDTKRFINRTRNSVRAAAGALHADGRFPALLFADLNAVAWTDPDNALRQPHLAVAAPGIIVVKARRWEHGFIVLTPDGLLNLPDMYSATGPDDLMIEYRPTLPDAGWETRAVDDTVWFRYGAKAMELLEAASS